MPYGTHRYHNDTPTQGVRDVLKAGTDVDCGTFVTDNAQATLDQHLIQWSDVDARLANLWRVRMRLGHFDPVGPLQSDYSIAKDVCSKKGVDLSMEGLIQSAVLLKNVDNTLPFVRSAATAAATGGGGGGGVGRGGVGSGGGIDGGGGVGSVVVVGANANYSYV